MKKVVLLFISLLVGFTILHAQEPLSFEKVIKVDSVGKNEIYNAVKKWVTLKTDSKSTIEVDDRETGIVILKLSTEFNKSGFWYVSYAGYIDFTVSIQIKDNRFKVTVDKLIHTTKESRSISKLGLIKSGEYKDGTINASFDKKVWIDLQQKCEVISSDIFDMLSNLKFKSDNW